MRVGMGWPLGIALGALCVGASVSAQEEGKPAVVRTTEAAAADAGIVKKKKKPKPQPKTVTLRIDTRPRVRAGVYWGKEKLGVTPLTLRRARNSGPLDVKVAASGYITVNTRLYTFRDDDLTVTLTKSEEANKLYGYKKPLPPDAGVPDEGVSEEGVSEDAPGGEAPAPTPAPAPPPPPPAPASP